MKRATPTLAVILWLVPAFTEGAMATEGHDAAGAQAAQERVLGSAEEDAAWRSLLPFTRAFHAEGMIAGTLANSTAAAGIPAAAMVEALRALHAAIDPEREVHDGDRFYVRWEQTFTIDNRTVGIGRVLSLELSTKVRGTIAISRFRSLGQPTDTPDRFWLVDGTATAPARIRLPLEVVTITSGFGLRTDPLDQLAPTPAVLAAAPQSAPEAAAIPAAAPRKAEYVREIARARAGFGSGEQLGSVRPAALGGDNFELERVMAERRVRAREAQARQEAERQAAESEAAAAAAAAAAQEADRRRAPPTQRPVVLFMHEGLDLLGAVGTPVFAAAAGVVTLARPDLGYGNAIRIAHADRLTTIYGHLSRFAPGIEPGAMVERGQLIGLVGSSGRSTRAHLHFELLVAGKPVDPRPAALPEQLSPFDLARFKKHLLAEKTERALDSRLALEAAGDSSVHPLSSHLFPALADTGRQ